MALRLLWSLVSTTCLVCVCLWARPALAQDSDTGADGASAATRPVKLPAPATDLCIGGNGRYILFHLLELKKIAVFDVNDRKIAGYIPASEDDILFAAGSTKALIVSGTQGIISRWNLKTLKRELTQSISVSGNVKCLLMGWNTEGPAILCAGTERYDSKVYEVDVNSLKMTDLKVEGRLDRALNKNSRISANGETVSVWEDHVSPSGLQSLFRSGNKWVARYEHDSVGAIHPTADGRHLLTHSGVYTKELQRIGERSANMETFLVPAVNGPLMLGLPVVDEGRTQPPPEPRKSQLFMVGDFRPLARDVPLQPIVRQPFNTNQPLLPMDKRTLFLPDAKLIIQVSKTCDELNCLTYDVEKALRTSSSNYLIITSHPPEQVVAGEVFDYQITYQSNAKKVSFNLETGPEDMTVSPKGKISWKTAVTSMPVNNVIVSVTSDDGQEAYHTFKLSVTGASGKESSAVAKMDGSAPRSPAVDAADLGSDKKELKLPSRQTALVVGGAGRYLMAHMPDLKKIAVIDVSTTKIKGYVPASDDQTLMAATRDKLLVVNVSQGVITRWNLASLKKEITVNSPFSGPIQSIAAGCAADGPAMVAWSQGTEQLDSVTLTFLDVGTLKEIQAVWPKGRPHASFRDYAQLRAASDGRYFTVAASSSSGAIMIDGTKITSALSFQGGMMLPSADGRYYASNGQIVNFEKSATSSDKNSLGLVIPSVTGNYYLSFPGANGYESTKNGAKVYMFGDQRPLVNLPDLNLEGRDRMQPNQNVQQANIFFIPDAKVIVKSSLTGESLEMTRFDVEDALEKSGVDYLVVFSRPQSTVQVGDNFEYAMHVKSKSGGVKFKLESGPTGMEVSPEGKVSWKVTADADIVNNTIISVSDSSGQEVFHTFAIEVPQLREKNARQQADKASEDQMRAAKSRLDALKAERQRNEVARQTPRNANSAKTPANKPPVFPMRTWTDSTGNHKIQAAFVKIMDKKLVVLAYADGSEKRIPLDRLSSDDIYYAVESDLNRLSGGTAAPAAEGNPFEEGAEGPKDSDAMSEQLELIAALDKRIDELVAIIEKESATTFIPKVFHPDVVEKLQAQSPPIDKLILLEKLLQIIPEKHQKIADSLYFYDVRVSFMKHDGQWLLGNFQN